MNRTLYSIIAAVLHWGLVPEVHSQEYWQQIAQPTTKDLLSVSFLDNSRGWMGGREGVIVRTIDGGESWTQQSSGISTDINQIYMLDNRIGWAITFVDFVDTLTYFGTRILKTTDGGSTWTTADFPITGEYFHAIVFRDSLHGFLGGERGSLFETTDAGTTWSRASVDSSLYANFPILNLQFLSQDCGFGMGGSLDFVGVVWRTTNGGRHWEVQAVSPEPVYEMHRVDSLTIVGIAGDFDFGASMVRTSNGGEGWEYTYLAIFGQPRALAFRTSNEGWAPVGQQFMVTFDTARSWEVMDTPGSRIVYDLAFTDSTTGFAAADSGAILKYYKPITNIGEAAPLPLTSALFQNYPNPFNPSTRIGFSIPDHGTRSRPPGADGQIADCGLVTIKVFDVLGREVVTLVNEQKSPGRYTVQWDASNVVSGVYFYRLEAGMFVKTQKMVVVK